MRTLKPNVFDVGAVDWDRRAFDELILLPGRASCNAYPMRTGGKIIQTDAVNPAKTDNLMANLQGKLKR